MSAEKIIELSKSMRLTLDDQDKVKNVETLIEDEWQEVARGEVGFYLDGETGNFGWGLQVVFNLRLDEQEAKELYDSLMKERNELLRTTENRLERYEIIEKYSHDISRLRRHYIKDEEQIREELPHKTLKIVETTLRTEIENYRMLHPDAYAYQEDDEEPFYGYYFHERNTKEWDGNFICRKCGTPFYLDDIITEIHFDAYDFDHPLILRYHKKCAPTTSLTP